MHVTTVHVDKISRCR